MNTKYCRKCLTEKPLDAFYASRGNCCKVCAKVYDDERKTTPARMAQLNAWNEKRRQGRAPRPTPMTKEQSKAKIAQQNAEWRAMFPERFAAHRVVYSALQDGRLVRHPCLVCGGKPEAHHPDYSRPLDVVWLCRSHHKQVHATA